MKDRTILLGFAGALVAFVLGCIIWMFWGAAPDTVPSSNLSISPRASQGGSNQSSSSAPSGNQKNSPSASGLASNSAASDRPLSMVGGHAVSYPGSFAKAQVTANGHSYTLTPNQLGNFQRVDIKAREKIQVAVSYPKGEVGDPVQVEVKDGGHINADQMAEVAKLDNQKNVQFQFQSTNDEGIYRIALRDGSDVKVLNFWVGPEPQVRE